MKYEAVEYVLQWSEYFLVIVPTVTGAVVTYQSLRRTLTDDSSVIADSKRKIKNTFKAAIIVETITGFISIVKEFYL